MNYTNQTALSQATYPADEPDCAPGELDRLGLRLENVFGAMQMVTAGLSAHADRLHGAPQTTSGQVEKPRPDRSGALGRLEDLIDLMSDQAEQLSLAASRNTTLA